MSESETWYWAERSNYRRGDRPIKIRWQGGEAGGVLYDVGVPITAQAIAAALPLSVPVVQVAWSGDMLMGTKAYEIDAHEMENETRLVQPGDLAWDPKFEELTFCYGPAEAYLPSGPNTLVVYGAITENLSGFAEFCRRRRFEGVGQIELISGTEAINGSE